MGTNLVPLKRIEKEKYLKNLKDYVEKQSKDEMIDLIEVGCDDDGLMNSIKGYKILADSVNYLITLTAQFDNIEDELKRLNEKLIKMNNIIRTGKE